MSPRNETSAAAELAARAAALARPQTAADAATGRAFVIVKAAGERFALPAARVARVQRFEPLLPVPSSATEGLLTGALGGSGALVIVVVLARWLGLDAPVASDAWIVVVGTEDEALGVLCDEVVEVADVDTAGARAGVLPDGTTILDVQVLLSDPRLLHVH